MMQEGISSDTRVKIGISGSTLKLIAIVTMLIDHIGAAVLVRMMYANAVERGMAGVVLNDNLYKIYNIMRGIGRLAFPIFCFLLVEGFMRTHNKAKYALRLGVFAIISEIPFDLAFSSQILEFSYQNVYFTLFIGLLTMIAVDAVYRLPEKLSNEKTSKIMGVARYLIAIGIMAAGAFVAELIHTDYSAKGVLCIMALYVFHWNKATQVIAGFCVFLWERIASFAFIPIAFYNGKRGLKLKYVFYLFYPLHLLILYLICVALGISGYSIV